MTQQINKLSIFSLIYKTIAILTARLLVWLRHRSKISLESEHVKQKEQHFSTSHLTPTTSALLHWCSFSLLHASYLS